MQSIATYSMVVPLEPAENWPSMKMPVGKFTLPLKASWLNSYDKVVDDIVVTVVGCVEHQEWATIRPGQYIERICSRLFLNLFRAPLRVILFKI